MTLQWIAVDGCKLAHVSGSPISGGTFTITTTPHGKVAVDDAGIFAGAITFTFAKGNSAGFVKGTVAGGGSIMASAINVTADGQAVVLKGDTGTLSASGTLTGGGVGSVSGGVKVSASGQQKVRAE